jgi:hypothetical protein
MLKLVKSQLHELRAVANEVEWSCSCELSHLYKPVFAKLLITHKEETDVIFMYDDYHVYLDKAGRMLVEGYLSKCSRIWGKIIIGLILIVMIFIL